MNIFLLSLIDKSIGDAIVKFSKLPVQSLILSPKHQQILVGLSEKMIDAYLAFFKSVRIIPVGFDYTKTIIINKFNSVDFEANDLDFIEKKLISLIKTPFESSLVPVNVNMNHSKKLFWYIGIAILEKSNQHAEFFLHKFSINTLSIRYSLSSLHYLDRILEERNTSESVSPRMLAANYGKNYNQFQKDCRIHFGDTFHQFHNKMKMLNAVTDILFTNYSLKEIAYRNQFFNYNSMYILFRKKYKFPIDSIPRLLTEI